MDPIALELQNLRYSLFLKRRFLPIFMATFLGVFNDNLIRSGLVVLITYSASQGITLPAQPEILVTMCSALLVIPMLLFSSTAGALADKYEKSLLVRFAKVAEVGIMVCAWYGFAHHNIILLMCLLFVSGMHTSFYSPIRFSILPDHLSNKELLAGNGFIASGSYLAVLFGLISGGLLVEDPRNLIGAVALAIAFTGWLASLFILPSRIAHPEMKIGFNIWRESKHVISYAWQDKAVVRLMFGLSWFWLVGSFYMSQFANYAHAVVRADNQVYILFLTTFSIGIMIGSLMTDLLLKGEISLHLTPWSLLGVSVFTYGMLATTPLPTHDGMQTIGDFLSVPQHWTMLGCMLMVAVSGGIYMVPLYAKLQSQTLPQYRSRVMAASNLSDAAFMTFIALFSALLLRFGFRITELFLLVATINLPVTYYARKNSH